MNNTKTNTAGARTHLETTLHRYRFDVSKPEDKEQYAAMVARIKKDGGKARGKWMNAWGGDGKRERSKDNTSETVQLETSCLFDNQWNSETERLFDWYEEYPALIGKQFKIGHWLEITPEMAAARTECRKCGYCGKQYGPLHEMPVPADGFCRACLDSPYLKEADLHLLRLLPLTDRRARLPLSADERAALLPIYVERQTTGSDSRAKARRDKERADVLKKYESETSAATTERDGLLWLWDKGLSLDNVIYYSHTGTFSFGWRSPVSESVKSRILDVISEFPFPYEIKSEGRTLSAV